MRLTNREILDASGGVRTLVDFFLREGSFEKATLYGLTARYLSPFGDEIVDARNALIRKHSGGKDSIPPNTEERNAFAEEWREYQECEVEVDMEPIVLEEGILKRLDGNLFIALLPILDIRKGRK